MRALVWLALMWLLFIVMLPFVVLGFAAYILWQSVLFGWETGEVGAAALDRALDKDKR